MANGTHGSGTGRASALAAIPLALGLAAVGLETFTAEGVPDAPGAAIEVVFFDVGQGDAAVITSVEADPKVVVIDGGFKKNVRESIARFLEARGVSEIDLMILTHPDMDHVSGLRALIDEFEVLEIWDPGFAHDTATYANFVALASAEAGSRYYSPFEEQVVDFASQDTDDEAERLVVLGEPEDFGRFEIIPLHSNQRLEDPDGGSLDDAYLVNNSSIVVKIVVGDNSILFTGDANGRSPEVANDERGAEREEEARFTEAALLALEAEEPGILRSTVLKVPHHGSLTSSSHQLIEAVRPQWAVVSSGISQHHLPREHTLARYGAARTNILRTDVVDTTGPSDGDDHLVLLMGEAPGHLVWRQASTRSLLESLGGAVD